MHVAAQLEPTQVSASDPHPYRMPKVGTRSDQARGTLGVERMGTALIGLGRSQRGGRSQGQSCAPNGAFAIDPGDASLGRVAAEARCTITFLGIVLSGGGDDLMTRPAGSRQGAKPS